MIRALQRGNIINYKMNFLTLELSAATNNCPISHVVTVARGRQAATLAHWQQVLHLLIKCSLDL